MRIDHPAADALLTNLLERIARDKGSCPAAPADAGAVVSLDDAGGDDGQDGDSGVFLGAGRPDSIAADEVWISMEDKGPLVKGQPIDFNTIEFAHTHDRGIAARGLRLAAVAKLGTFTFEPFNCNATPRDGSAGSDGLSGSDLRTLPVIYDKGKRRRRIFNEGTWVHRDQVRRLAS